MTEREPYWLLDTVLGQRDPCPIDMSTKEAAERNEFMERQHSRWRWMSRSELTNWDSNEEARQAIGS